MPLQPIDKRNPLETREAIWLVIRSLKSFTITDIELNTAASRDSIRDYLSGLTAAGFLSQTYEPAHRGSTMRNRYTLERDNGVEAPAVNRDGTIITMGMGREHMWRTMRIMQRFTPQELAIHAATAEVPVPLSAARDYCQALNHAGYLQVITPAKPGKQARYYLPQRSFTGPKPPIVQRGRKKVYDPNLKKIVWTREGSHDPK